MTLRRIRVAVMGRFFFYLPLYYAVENKLPALLRGTQYEDARIDQVITHRLIKTDVDVVRALRRNSPLEFSFGACDPLALLSLEPDELPEYAVVAALVTNSAFWAADHNSHKIGRFSDLAQYARIIGYGPGSTSYRILSRIRSHSLLPDRPMIVSVEKGEELRHLDQSIAAPDSLVITPDLPGILQAKKCLPNVQIEMALARTEEFQHVLTTALITRTDMISKHRRLVVALVAALEEALREVRCGTKEVRHFADEYFEEFKYEENGSDLIREAFELAREHRVFPSTVAIPERDWAAAFVPGHAEFGEAGLTSSTQLPQSPATTYRRLVQAHESLLTDALELVGRSISQQASGTIPRLLLEIGLLGSAVVGALHLTKVLQRSAQFWWAGALACLLTPLPFLIDRILAISLSRAERTAFTLLWYTFTFLLVAAIILPDLTAISSLLAAIVYGCIFPVFCAAIAIPGRKKIKAMRDA